MSSIECEDYPDIIIFSNGTLTYKDGRPVKTWDNGNGYLRTRVRHRGESQKRVVYVHRVVCTAYWGVDVHRPHVNHLNGIRHDNSYNNLEWCTAAENNKHATDVMGGNKKPIKVMYMSTGLVDTFDSIKAFADRHDIAPPIVSSALSRHKSGVLYGKYAVKWLEDNTPWPDTNKRYHSVRSQSIVVINYADDTITIYKSMSKAASEEGVSIGWLCDYISNGYKYVYKGRVYMPMVDRSKLPTRMEAAKATSIRSRKETGRPLVATKLGTDNKLKGTPEDLSRHLLVKPSTIYTKLRKKNTAIINGFSVSEVYVEGGQYFPVK